MRRAAILALVLALSAATAGAARGQAVAPGHGAGGADAFWRALGDPVLERLVGQAVEANLDLRAADARVRGARAARVDAALDLAPTVTASSGYSRQRLPQVAAPGAAGPLPDLGQWDAGVQLAWDLDVFGRGRRTLQGRNAMLDAAEEEVRDVRTGLAAEVAHAYFELRGAQARLAVARRNAENQGRTLDLTRDRLEAGSGTALDTERAQVQLSSTLAMVPALEAAIAASHHRLGVLLGQPPASLGVDLVREAEPTTLPAAPELADPEAWIRRRADVRGAERRLAAQGARVAAARSDYLPRIAIAGTAGYTARAFDALGAAGTPHYAFGPVVTWPLLDLGRVRTGVDAARAGEAEAAARYGQAMLRAGEEIETTLATYRAAHDRLRHLEQAAAASERATELARLRFEEGATGFLEVLDTERTQLEAQDRLAQGRAEAAVALVAVYRAFGGHWPGGPDGPR